MVDVLYSLSYWSYNLMLLFLFGCYLLHITIFGLFFFFSEYGVHRDLHVLTHSFPTLRSSDLHNSLPVLRSSAIRRPSSAPTNSLSPHTATPRLTTSQQAETARSPGTSGSNFHKDLPVAASQALTFDQAWVTYMRSEEHTSELQSLMRISYAVFCLKQKK